MHSVKPTAVKVTVHVPGHGLPEQIARAARIYESLQGLAVSSAPYSQFPLIAAHYEVTRDLRLNTQADVLLFASVVKEGDLSVTALISLPGAEPSDVIFVDSIRTLVAHYKATASVDCKVYYREGGVDIEFPRMRTNLAAAFFAHRAARLERINELRQKE